MKKYRTKHASMGASLLAIAGSQGDIDVECSALIASRLAPTVVQCHARDLRATQAALAANFS
jgi:hypothetical protein